MKKFLAFILCCLVATPAFAERLRGKQIAVKEVDRLNFTPERTVVLKGVVNFPLTDAVSKRLAELDDGKPILLVINSPGGNVAAGYDVIKTMEELDSPLTCVVDDMAYSMGAIIAAYCPRLYVHKRSSIMFHEISWTVQGNETTHKIRQKHAENDILEMDKDIAKKLGISVKEFKAKKQIEWWMTASQAVSCGFATAIVNHLKYAEPPKEITTIMIEKGKKILQQLFGFAERSAFEYSDFLY